jgi:hypothetical protein
MLTLTNLLLPPETELAASIKKALADEGLEVTAGGAAHVPASGLRLMSGTLARHLVGLLDIGLGDVLVSAWNKAFAVRQQLEKSAKSPGKEMFLQLAEHKISSEHKPYVALMKDGQELGRVAFAVALELTLHGAVLKIRDGSITAIQTGRIKGKGSVKCGRFILVEKEIPQVDIPGISMSPRAPNAETLHSAELVLKAV